MTANLLLALLCPLGCFIMYLEGEDSPRWLYVLLVFFSFIGGAMCYIEWYRWGVSLSRVTFSAALNRAEIENANGQLSLLGPLSDLLSKPPWIDTHHNDWGFDSSLYFELGDQCYNIRIQPGRFLFLGSAKKYVSWFRGKSKALAAIIRYLKQSDDPLVIEHRMVHHTTKEGQGLDDLLSNKIGTQLIDQVLLDARAAEEGFEDSE